MPEASQDSQAGGLLDEQTGSIELRPLTGGQVVAECLHAAGVPYMVGIPGHGCLGLVDAFVGRDSPRLIQVRQETAAVHLADGYYRASGQPLSVFTSIGPGAINTAIGLATAFVDSTAVLALSGDTHMHMLGRGVLQEIERRHDSDFASIVRPVTKRSWLGDDASRLPGIMRRAFRTMLSGRRGPVHVALPMDVQAQMVKVPVPRREDFLPPAAPEPDARAVGRAWDLLRRAERPLILAGGGVAASNAYAELRQLAETVGAAVVTTLQAKDVFPNDHPLYGWLTGSKGTSCGITLCCQADVILAVGCRFADETSSSYVPGKAFNIPPTELIHVDIDENEIGKNYPARVGIVADAKAALSALLELAESEPKREWQGKTWQRTIERERSRWLEHVESWADDSRQPVMISSLLRHLRAALPRQAIVTSSSGNTQAQLLQEFPFYEPRTNLTTGGFSTMGFAYPAGLGAKLAQPNRQVVALMGDGDFLMAIQELATAVQYGIAVVAVVANNAGWLSIRDLQHEVYGAEREMAVEFGTTPDFAAVARDFGAWGERVSRADEIEPALARAFASGGPAVLEVMVNREYPYSGGSAQGWWDVPVPEYLADRRARYEDIRSLERL
jgi:acetolactate synthase-1/2/3 large subunit